MLLVFLFETLKIIPVSVVLLLSLINFQTFLELDGIKILFFSSFIRVGKVLNR